MISFTITENDSNIYWIEFDGALADPAMLARRVKSLTGVMVTSHRRIDGKDTVYVTVNKRGNPIQMHRRLQIVVEAHLEGFGV